MIRRLLPCLLLLDHGLAQVDPGPLHAPSVVLPTGSAPFQRLLDIDGDGDLDAVGTRVFSTHNKYELRLWRNDRGELQLLHTVEVVRSVHGTHKPTVMRVAVGDWNGDGRDDFVVGTANLAELFLMQAGGQFTRQLLGAASAGGAWAIDVGFADFDGDRLDDVAVLEQPLRIGLQPRITLHFAKGGVAHTAIDVQVAGRLDVLDTDGGGAREVAAFSGTRYQPFQLVQGQLQALPALVTSIRPTVGSVPWLWMAGDIDGDRDDDVVVFQPAAAANFQPLYEVFRRTGPQAWTREAQAVGGPAEYLADIDGDGDLDGVCCGGGGGTPSKVYPKLDFPSTFELARNDGKGGFEPAWAFPGAGSRSLAGVADLDGDGDVELVAGRCVFYGQGPWTRHPMPPTGQNVAVLRRAAVADGDGDGDIDLLHNPYGGSRGRGDGSFANLRLAGVRPPDGFAFGGGFHVDFDGDGAGDVVAAMFRSTAQGRVFDRMVLLRNNGGGTYHYAGPVGPPGLQAGFGFTVDHFADGDLDGDGDLDLVANSRPDRDGYKCELYWHDAQGLSAGPRFPTHRFEGVADFDRDGRPDLLLSTGGGSLWWARGVGNRAAPFAAPVALGVSAGFQPNGIEIADVNRDGRPDVVVATYPIVTLVLNFASGFTRVGLTGIETGKENVFVTTGDFDGNGTTDLVVGPVREEPNTAWLLLGKPLAGPLLRVGDFRVLQKVIPGGFAADVDGDGDTDLVASHTVSSTRYHGPAAGSKRQFGDGTPGEGGAVPVLGVAGPLRPGQAGRLLVRGLPGPTVALVGLAAGTAELPGFPLPGMTFRLDPGTLVVIPLPVTGQGRGRGAAGLVVPYTIGTGLAGATIFVQAVILDAQAAGGASITNALAERVGR